MHNSSFSFFVAITLVLASMAATSAAAFSTYQSRVPNGSVARCGTCHTNANVGGEGWNDFGKDLLLEDPDVEEADLESNNQNINYDQIPAWSANLCGLDSDGDGQSNGEELGDPACSWVFGESTAFPRTTDISNPGDAASTSANPTGTDDGGEEGEGEGGEGEGEGEPPEGGCSSTNGTPMSALAALVLAAIVVRRRRR